MEKTTSIQKKLVVVGDSSCGKTCLLVAFSKNEFSRDSLLTTASETYTKSIKVDDQNILLTLWDTAGEEGLHRLLHPLSYQGTDVVLICFSVDDESSFLNVKERWAPEIKHFCPRISTILVANKLDLRDDREVGYTRTTTMTYEQGKQMAKKIKADMYLENSAETMQGLNTVFENAARLSLKEKRRKKTCKLL